MPSTEYSSVAVLFDNITKEKKDGCFSYLVNLFLMGMKVIHIGMHALNT